MSLRVGTFNSKLSVFDCIPGVYRLVGTTWAFSSPHRSKSASFSLLIKLLYVRCSFERFYYGYLLQRVSCYDDFIVFIGWFVGFSIQGDNRWTNFDVLSRFVSTSCGLFGACRRRIVSGNHWWDGFRQRTCPSGVWESYRDLMVSNRHGWQFLTVFMRDWGHLSLSWGSWCD